MKNFTVTFAIGTAPHAQRFHLTALNKDGTVTYSTHGPAMVLPKCRAIMIAGIHGGKVAVLCPESRATNEAS